MQVNLSLVQNPEFDTYFNYLIGQVLYGTPFFLTDIILSYLYISGLVCHCCKYMCNMSMLGVLITVGKSAA